MGISGYNTGAKKVAIHGLMLMEKMMINLAAFKGRTAPETGRRAIQLTSGPGFCYPLYYFIGSMTADDRYLIYHRALDGEVQLHRLDLTTGESVQITQGTTAETGWLPWCVESGQGVLDHRSVLNEVRGEVIYFDQHNVRAVHVETLADRLLFQLPADRIAIGQNCVTPDGQWLAYIHHDRASHARMHAEGYWDRRHISKGTALSLYHFETGEQRDLVFINSPIHHVLPYGDSHLVFCHPTMENGMLLTDLNGGWYTHMRTQDAQGGCVCHYIATARGIAYEVLGRSDGVWAGVYDPFSHRHYEWPMPRAFGYTHTGCDPEGRLFFYENSTPETHDLRLLARHVPDGEDEWLSLTGDWPTFGERGQKTHFHPRLTRDRQWIIMVAGDPETQTNQIFLLDASDLTETAGIPDVTHKA